MMIPAVVAERQQRNRPSKVWAAISLVPHLLLPLSIVILLLCLLPTASVEKVAAATATAVAATVLAEVERAECGVDRACPPPFDGTDAMDAAILRNGVDVGVYRFVGDDEGKEWDARGRGSVETSRVYRSPFPVTATATAPPAAADATTATTSTLERNGSRWNDYLSAVDRAVRWLDRLVVDPASLQKVGVKGKKKLGEIMAAYAIAVRYGEDDPIRLGRYRRRLSELAQKARGPTYHNLASCDGREFRQNSMSYLRVLRLIRIVAEEKGMASSDLSDALSEYEAELRKVKRRFDEDLPNRGPWQRAMFARYYKEFGLDMPPLLRAMLKSEGSGGVNAVVSMRLPSDKYDKHRSYELTHEVFVAFDYGLSLEQHGFSVDDLAYLSEILPILIDKKIDSTITTTTAAAATTSTQDGSRNVESDTADIVAEYLTCMAYLKLHGHPAAQRGRDYLLDNQNESGTWGKYESIRERFGDVVDQHLYLHTTYVSMQALHELYRRHAPQHDCNGDGGE